MKDGVILRVSKPARMGIDDASLYCFTVVFYGCAPRQTSRIPSLIAHADLAVFLRVYLRAAAMAPEMKLRVLRLSCAPSRLGGGVGQGVGQNDLGLGQVDLIRTAEKLDR